MPDPTPVNGEETPVAAPLSWRDVYKAVGDSETRIIAAVNAAVNPLTSASADHEARIRAIEHVAPDAVEALALARANDKAIDRILGRESGIFSTLGAGKTTLVTVAACLGPILAMVALLSK